MFDIIYYIYIYIFYIMSVSCCLYAFWGNRVDFTLWGVLGVFLCFGDGGQVE